MTVKRADKTIGEEGMVKGNSEKGGKLKENSAKRSIDFSREFLPI